MERMDAAKEIKTRLDVADVIGDYLQLKPAGVGSFKACCPFHQENTPSFYVNRARQSFHCFGCDKGGDIIAFVQEMEGMAFRETLELLAQKAGITLPAPSPQEAQKADERRRLKELNEQAAKFFRAVLLQSPEAEQARAYATKRGIDDLTGDLFKIGYAPGSSWDALTQALIAKGANAEELIKAGLSVKHPERGTVYDRFRDRLMFAIQDLHGNVVGFTGRLLSDDKTQAKYVNTPETAIYHKSSVLYGLDKAKTDIKRQDLAVITEGNMDVLTSHRLGVTNVICSSGTALTDEQLRLIERFTKNIAIAFDADKAGMAATLRGLDLARTRDFNVKLITLPPEAGKDPDEAASKDITLWKDAIRNAQDVMEWVFHAAFKGRDISQPQTKKEIAQDVFPEIQRIADPIVRDHWLQKLAVTLNTNVSALQEALRRHAAPRNAPTPQKPSRNTPYPILHTKKDRGLTLGERIIAVLLIDPHFIAQVPPGAIQDLPESLQSLYSILKERYDSARSNERAISPDELMNGLGEQDARLVDYLVMLADREFPDRTGKALAAELAYLCELLTKSKNNGTLKRLTEDMVAAEAAGDTERINALTAQFQSVVSRENP
jgi:DNA primase